MYRSSRYNHFVYLNDREVALFNFLWKSLAIFTREEFSAVESLIGAPTPISELDAPKLVRDLVDLSFLVGTDVDELVLFRDGYFDSLYNPVLTLMVLPTLRCNFDCPYCFEFKRPVDMDDATRDATLAWAEKKLHNMRHFHVTWFGGEPLMGQKLINSFSQAAMLLAERFNCSYSGSITTNGYLLSERVIRELEVNQIFNVHVTLDGGKDYHDNTRYIKGPSKGTFDRLCANIELYCRISNSHLPINLRVNVTDANYDSIQNIFETFSDTVKKRSRIYFRYVWSNEASGYKSFVAEKENPFEKISALYDKAAQYGFHIDNPVDEAQFNYCEVDFANHYTIDPLGNIYLCTHTFKPEDAVGSVFDGLSRDGQAIYSKWLDQGPFNDAECMSCKVLPICKGGCRKSRFFGKKACIDEKHSMDEYVRNLVSKQEALNTGGFHGVVPVDA